MRESRCNRLSSILLLMGMTACTPQSESDPSVQNKEGMTNASERGVVSADEFQLRYVVEGAGTPAIVIGSSVYLPRAFSQNLRKDLRMAFMDHRGYAPSPGSMDSTAFSLDKMLDDMERARQQLGLGTVVIIGHSIHSVMALEYAKKYPESVSHIVMIGSAALNRGNEEVMNQYWEELASPERKAALEENRARLPDAELEKLPPGDRFLQTYIREGPRTWYDPHFDASWLWEGVEYNDDYGRAQPFQGVDITKGLDTLERPVLLALGRYDFRVAPPASWEPIKPKFHDLTIKIFDHSGHWPHYEEASAFDAALLEWMRDTQS